MENHPKRIRQEKATLAIMVKIYCGKIHHSHAHECHECSDLLAYANNRLDRCPYGEDKPACSACTIHCYSSEYRRKIKAVMRFAGPRMIFSHPILAIRHLMQSFHRK